MVNPSPLDDSVNRVLDAAERAQAQGQAAEAERLWSVARSLSPDHPFVSAAMGVRALRNGNAAEAREFLEKAVQARPLDPSLYLNLATALRALGDSETELRTLDRALELDPFFFPLLLQKASLLERTGNTKDAARMYGRALASLRPGDQIPAAWQPHIEYAQRMARADQEQLESWLDSRMQPVRQQHTQDSQERVDHCLQAILGKRRIYVQQPTHTHFPSLPAIEFYDRRDFPWVGQAEAATEEMRAELMRLLNEARGDFAPYLNHAPTDALSQWRELNQSKRWSALFLHKYGERIEHNIARCPRTVAALEGAPVVRIPGRGPTSLFSLLEPKTRIPPHTGVTNTRLTVHIPLIVPPNCGFRVGSQTREWVPGTALIFDDTIEHEAWNDSEEPRVVLIFDIWNPFLTPAERDLMTAATAAIAEYYGD